MNALVRYTRLLGTQLRMSTVPAMQYRSDFILRGAMVLLWLGVTLVPLISVFQQRATVWGWFFLVVLVVVGCFLLLLVVLEGAISPSLTSVVVFVCLGFL